MNRNKSTVANATRLFNDAKLLRDHGRYGSAFALAVLILEEIGKLVLRSWGAGGTTNHIRKQRAASALLVAEFAVKTLGTSLDQVTPKFVERIQLSSGETGRFAIAVEVRGLDKTKQRALYSDDWLQTAELYADRFTDRDVQHIFDKCLEAITALEDPSVMKIGKTVFRVLEAEDAKLQSLLRRKR